MNLKDLILKAKGYGFQVEAYGDEYRVFYDEGELRDIVVSGCLSRCMHILDNY